MFKYSNVKVLAFHNILLVEDIISIKESIFISIHILLYKMFTI